MDIYVHWKIGKITLKNKRHLRVISVIHHLSQWFQHRIDLENWYWAGSSVFLFMLNLPFFSLSQMPPVRCFHDGNCSQEQSSRLIDGQCKAWKMLPSDPSSNMSRSWSKANRECDTKTSYIDKMGEKQMEKVQERTLHHAKINCQYWELFKFTCSIYLYNSV